MSYCHSVQGTYNPTLQGLMSDGYILWDFDYPIFDESYRAFLEQLITDTFLFREVSAMPYEKWKHYFKTWFQANMNYYNARYVTMLYNIDPFITKQLKTSSIRDIGIKRVTGSTSVNKRYDKTDQTIRDRYDLANVKGQQTIFDETVHDENETITDKNIDFTSNETTKDLISKQHNENETTNVIGSKESETDYTSDVSRETDLTKDTTHLKLNNGTLDRNEVGNSETDMEGSGTKNYTNNVNGTTTDTTETESNTNSTLTKSHSDFPQGNSANPPANYLSFTESETANTDATGKSTSNGTSTADTTHDENTTQTANTTVDETKDIDETSFNKEDYDENNVSHETMQSNQIDNTKYNEVTTSDTERELNSTDESQQNKTVDTVSNTNEHIQSNYEGTEKTDSQEDVESSENETKKSFSAQNIGYEKDSRLFTNEDRKTKTQQLDNIVLEGFEGRTLASLLIEFRTSFINVDLEILKELERFFYGLW